MLMTRGVNFTKLREADLPELDKLAYVFWACLVHEDSTLTVDSVKDILRTAMLKHRDDPNRYRQETAAGLGKAFEEIDEECRKNQDLKEFLFFMEDLHHKKLTFFVRKRFDEHPEDN
jgi:hypothetical protein